MYYAQCVKYGMKTIQTVKGMTNMNYPKDICDFINDLVDDYSKYDSLSKSYTLNVNDIPDFLQYEFSVKLMSFNSSLASEATGPDNDLYYTKMLPALMRHLSNSNDKDEQIEFIKEWRDGVSSYFHKELQELINDSCNDKINCEMVDAGFHIHRHRDNDEIYWSKHL